MTDTTAILMAINKNIGELNGKVESLIKTVDDHVKSTSKTQTDHDKRIRSLEGSRHKVAGIWAASSFVLLYLARKLGFA